MEVGEVELGVPELRHSFWLADNYKFVRAEKSELKFVRRKNSVVALMLVLENAVVQVYRCGKLIAELKHPCYCPWLSGILRARLHNSCLPNL